MRNPAAVKDTRKLRPRQRNHRVAKGPHSLHLKSHLMEHMMRKCPCTASKSARGWMYISMKETMFRGRATAARRTSLRYLYRTRVDGMDQVSGFKVVALFAQLSGHPAGVTHKHETENETLKLEQPDNNSLRYPPIQAPHSTSGHRFVTNRSDTTLPSHTLRDPVIHATEPSGSPQCI